MITCLFDVLALAITDFQRLDHDNNSFLTIKNIFDDDDLKLPYYKYVISLFEQ